MLLTPPRTLIVIVVPLLVCGLVAGVPSQGRAAQQTQIAPDDSLVSQVQTLYREGRHRESLTLLRPHLGHQPQDYAAWVLASREALVLGYADATSDSAKAWLHRAIAYGDSAQALNPQGEDGRYVTIAAMGQLALIESGIEKARLARRVEHDALQLLAMDSLHAGAHNAVGKVYFEIARLSRVQRWVARVWLGGDLLARASWTAAEYHLRRAVELQPERNFYHLDLGRLLLARGRPGEARVELQRAIDVPLETPEQQGFRRQARALLASIDSTASGDSASASGGGAP